MNLIPVLKSLFRKLPNSEAATLELLKSLKVPVNETFIRRQLEEHPDYPSLTAIVDVLRDLRVDSLALKTNDLQETELLFPAIAQITLKGTKYFTVITEVTQHWVAYYHPLTNVTVTLSLEEFYKIFTGVLLMVETNDKSGEQHYQQLLLAENRQQYPLLSTAIVILAFTFIAISLTAIYVGLASIWAILFTLLSLAGTIVCTLLVLQEVDRDIPLLQKICSGNKTNCSSILESGASTIFGFKWSIIGFSFFLGNVLSLTVAGVYYLPALFVLSWLNILALPYIFYSIYYQAIVARKWCILCLTTITILILQLGIALLGHFHTFYGFEKMISPISFGIAISFILSFLSVTLLSKALYEQKENRRNRIAFKRLKHNPQIFKALLPHQKSVVMPDSNLGIMIGNPDSKPPLGKSL